MADNSMPLGGSNLNDLVSTQKGGVQNLSNLALGITNALPPATASASPAVIGINNLGTTATSIIGTSVTRFGIVFHNPATANVNAYIFPTNATPAPTLSAPGGAFIIFPGETLPFPSIAFANVNVGFSAFVSSGTSGALTILEFR